MKIEAAVLWNTGEDWSVEEIDLAGPGPDEVLVRYVASGLCHSDDHIRTGDLPVELPTVGGHEGAGVVEEVGADVRDLAPGDHVVASFIPSCGKCRWCATGRQNICDLGARIGLGSLSDERAARRARGQNLRANALLGTFASHGTVSQDALIKIDPAIPLERACLVGCGVTTGYGSAVNTARVEPGDTVVVVGCGGIGTAAIQGARIAGAENIVAVDPTAEKRPLLEKLGATHFAASMSEATELVRDLTSGVMADSAILTVGVVRGAMIGELLELVRKAGTAVLTGLAPADEVTATLPMLQMTLYQKSLRGSLFGEANARADIPKILSLYRRGLLNLDDMVTAEYRLADVNQGYADMLAGHNIRGIIRHEPV